MLYSLYFIKVTNYSLWISGCYNSCRSFGMWYSSMFFDELASTGSGTLKHLLMIFLRLSFWYLMRNGAGHCMNIVSCLGELLKKNAVYTSYHRHNHRHHHSRCRWPIGHQLLGLPRRPTPNLQHEKADLHVQTTQVKVKISTISVMGYPIEE